LVAKNTIHHQITGR